LKTRGYVDNISHNGKLILN